MSDPALTLFHGRAGDHNDRAMAGAPVLAAALERRFGLTAEVVGQPEPALNTGWREELEAARPDLLLMAQRFESIMEAGRVPVTALSRCAVALATLPVVARRRPDTVVLWFDAHADLNTPDTSTTGYLGGLALAGAAGLWDSGLGGDLETSRIVLGGVRDLDPAEQALVDDGTVRLAAVVGMTDTLEDLLGDRPVYFHLDCDVLQPGIVPTDYRVDGGMSLDQMHAVATLLARHEVVGIEIGEFEAPRAEDEGAGSPEALLDALEPLLAATKRP